MVTTVQRAAARMRVTKMNDGELVDCLRKLWNEEPHSIRSEAQWLIYEEVEVEALVRRLPELLAVFDDAKW